MKQKFIIVYRFDYYDLFVHGFDTIEEAIEDRKNYTDGYSNPIYQLVEEETKTTFTLPDGTVVENHRAS